MKALREFFVVLLSFVLVFLITTLGLFISLKNVVQTSIISTGVKSIVKDTLKNENYTPEQEKELEEAIEKVTSDKQIQELIDLAIQDVTNADNNNITISDETINKFISIVESNKKELIQFGITEEEINQMISEVKDPKNREEMQKSINEGYKELNINTGNNQSINIVKKYSELSSSKNISKIGVMIAVIVLLIALLKWSLYEWIRPCAISSIIASINILIVYYGIDFITKSILSGSELEVDIDTSLMSTVGYSILAGGITSLVIYIAIKVLLKINKKNASNTLEVKEEPKKILTEEIPVGEKDVPIEKDPINPKKFCSGCGAPITKDSEVCSYCNAPLMKKED